MRRGGPEDEGIGAAPEFYMKFTIEFTLRACTIGVCCAKLD